LLAGIVVPQASSNEKIPTIMNSLIDVITIQIHQTATSYSDQFVPFHHQIHPMELHSLSSHIIIGGSDMFM